MDVQHVWDPRTLHGRASTWEDVHSSAPRANLADARSKLGLSVPSKDESVVWSRSMLFASRRTRDSLAAMDRERAADEASADKGFKSAASLFSPSDISAMRPTYAPNESYATTTSGQLYGYGAKRVPLSKSRFNRTSAFPPDCVDCRNNPDRGIVERGMNETKRRARPWLSDPAPPVPEKPASHIIPRSQHSSFCAAGTLMRGAMSGGARGASAGDGAKAMRGHTPPTSFVDRSFFFALYNVQHVVSTLYFYPSTYR